MSVYIIDNGTRHKILLERLVIKYKPIVLDISNINKYDIKDSDLVILSGSRKTSVLWHYKTYKNEIKLVKSHKGPLIGICLGSELIAHAFGTHLHLLRSRRYGLVKIDFIDNNIVETNNKYFKAFEAHKWSVQKLNNPLTTLAVSNDGVEIFKHSKRPIYGMQFHPEKSNDLVKEIFSKIVDKLELDYKF